MSDRAQWTATTHDWSNDVDPRHLEEVRHRAAIDGAGGRRHLILEVLAYANDEAESIGRMGSAVVTMSADGMVAVADDGRGTDTRLDSDGRVIRKPVMATRDIRFFDAPDSPDLPDGLPRRGMSTVAALSSVLVHENHRANGAWSQTYRQGVPDMELREVRAVAVTGTTVQSYPDPSVQGPETLTEGDLSAFPWLRIELRRPRS